MGNVIEVLGKRQKKYYTCPKGFPPEYCSKCNVDDEFTIKTDTEKTLIIVQKYLGLNFEDSCDENKELLYDSSNKACNKRK